MNVLLAIPAKNQNQYIADMVEAIEAQTVKPCHVLYMPDRPTGKDLVEARKLVGNNPTGITLSDSCLMYPTKSVSGIIGIGPRMRRLEYGCPACDNKGCVYRRIVQGDK